MAATGYQWRFFRAGGLDQVRLEQADDLRRLAELDQKLWVALACPVKGTEIDQRTLKLLDGDGDGRIRAPEVISAVQWSCARLKDPSDLLKPTADLSLDAVDEAKPEGKAILASAKALLATLGRPNDRTVSVTELLDHQKILAKTAFNGDGVIVVESSDEPAVQAAIKDVATLFGTVDDRCGKPGVDKARIAAFCDALDSFAAWWDKGERIAAELSVGARAPQAYAALNAVRAKIDDWFVRSRFAAYDSRYHAAVAPPEAELKALATADLSKPEERLGALPIAQVTAGGALPLRDGINPAWAARVEALRVEVIAPLVGAETRALDEAQWRSLIARFAALDAWAASKQGGQVEKLGIARVRELIALDVRAKLMALIDRDIASGPEIQGFEAVERLARYRRDLGELLRNFVNFSVFYGRSEDACFQAGTLYLDSRHFDLCIRVDDPAAHAKQGLNARMYLAYCKCTRPSGESMFIAAAVTQGDSDYLAEGRNGIFYDRQGRDWDATIVKILDNPISIRQAFWSPYKKVIKLVQQQIETLAQAREKSVQDANESGVKAAASAVAQPGVAAAPVKKEPFDIARFAGIFAAIGLAVGAIGGAIGGIIAEFLKLSWWQMPLTILGLLIAISGPSMLVAWLKLRQRTLGPILEGIGWAVNGRVSVTIPLGTALTEVKQLPLGALRSLHDPFAQKKRTARWVTLAVVLAIAVAAALSYWYWWKPRQDAKAAAAAGQPAEAAATMTVKQPDGTTTTATVPAKPGVPPAPAAPVAPVAPAAPAK